MPTSPHRPAGRTWGHTSFPVHQHRRRRIGYTRAATPTILGTTRAPRPTRALQGGHVPIPPRAAPTSEKPANRLLGTPVSLGSPGRHAVPPVLPGDTSARGRKKRGPGCGLPSGAPGRSRIGAEVARLPTSCHEVLPADRGPVVPPMFDLAGTGARTDTATRTDTDTTARHGTTAGNHDEHHTTRPTRHHRRPPARAPHHRATRHHRRPPPRGRPLTHGGPPLYLEGPRAQRGAPRAHPQADHPQPEVSTHARRPRTGPRGAARKPKRPAAARHLSPPHNRPAGTRCHLRRCRLRGRVRIPPPAHARTPTPPTAMAPPPGTTPRPAPGVPRPPNLPRRAAGAARRTAGPSAGRPLPPDLSSHPRRPRTGPRGAARKPRRPAARGHPSPPAQPAGRSLVPPPIFERTGTDARKETGTETRPGRRSRTTTRPRTLARRTPARRPCAAPEVGAAGGRGGRHGTTAAR